MSDFEVHMRNMEKEFLEKFNLALSLTKGGNPDVCCDICGTAAKNDKGGVALQYDTPNRGTEVVCEDCFIGFCMVEKPETDTEDKRIALKNDIGRNSSRHLFLDASKTLVENRKYVLSRPDLFGSMTYTAKLENGKGISHVSKGEVVPPERVLLPCAACKKIFQEKELKKCAKCRITKYCSKKCQVSHWALHKLTCTRVDIEIPLEHAFKPSAHPPMIFINPKDTEPEKNRNQ